MSKKGKILVAMSGGIDSSIAALMLHEEGYEVIGITMKTWDYETSGSSKKETGCCSLDSINDARLLAVNAGFPHYILDIRSEFGNHIIDNFVDEYLAGRTPNPCVLCNTHIKWEALLKRADQLDCEFIATGHYAKIRNENDRYIISKGLDDSKDQSYVLWGLTQESLKRTIFPLGAYRKSEIKKMAEDSGYVDLANKSESYEICFVPDNDYRAFLKHKVQGLEEKVNGGNFIHTSGAMLGKHKGYPFYTIGQRKGLEIAVGEPLFVTEIIPETNTVMLGSKEDLEKQEMSVRNFNLIKYPDLKEPKDFLTKIRYKDAGTMAAVRQQDDKLKVLFSKKVTGVAPGQSAVFYEGDDLVGGGFIERAILEKLKSQKLKYATRNAFIGLIGLLNLLSCKKQTESISVDLGYEYFPNTIGNYVIYQVDSFYYNDFTLTIDTFHFQMKEKITENFNDLSQRVTQRIERFYRKNESDNWLLKDVWFANRTANSAEKVEENIRFVKIIFPLKLNNIWNGNRFNNLGEQNYSLSKLHEKFNLDNLKFDSTIYITQENDSNLIEKKIAYEVYAKHIGLVYKKQINIFDKNSVINYTLPLDLRANRGFSVIYKVIKYGKD